MRPANFLVAIVPIVAMALIERKKEIPSAHRHRGFKCVLYSLYYFSATILQISTTVIMAFSIAWIETYS